MLLASHDTRGSYSIFLSTVRRAAIQHIFSLVKDTCGTVRPSKSSEGTLQSPFGENELKNVLNATSAGIKIPYNTFKTPICLI